MKIINAEFIKGAVKAEQFPEIGVSEFAFFGRSNAGKSSLINALAGNEALRTGDLSRKYERGAHTTTKGSLNTIVIDKRFTGREGDEASIIDTPGIRRFVLHDIAPAAVWFYMM